MSGVLAGVLASICMILSILCCRYFTEDMVDPIAVTAGLVQTALYLDFFYVYFTKCVSPSLFPSVIVRAC